MEEVARSKLAEVLDFSFHYLRHANFYLELRVQEDLQGFQLHSNLNVTLYIFT